METPKKNKGGRPRKYGEKTSIQSLRVSQTIKSFCQSLDNANDFLIDTIQIHQNIKPLLLKEKQSNTKTNLVCLKGNNEPKRTH
ncbi:hypothetical protein [Helicobacter labetoulli]|uniref:hypothetical protein n=1 Tax=Helicobacter labetoulli TaxID=2315333 RepID=UPI000EF6D779|nr:hypothetical protein [Helicobacter labetoulli]